MTTCVKTPSAPMVEPKLPIEDFAIWDVNSIEKVPKLI